MQHVLRTDGGAVVIRHDGGVPEIVHWGPDPGDPPESLDALLDRPETPSTLTRTGALGVVTTAVGGWTRAGIEGARVGPDGAVVPAFPRFTGGSSSSDGSTASFRADAPDHGLRLDGTFVLHDVLAVRLAVTNTGETPFHLHRLAVTLPLPALAGEALTFDGHWCAEFTPRRVPWAGTLVVENRRGRTSHDHVPVAFAGEAGFGERSGSVHGVHVAWSGNSELRFEHLTDGRRIVQAGELLAPGEVVLAPGASYESPEVVGTWGDGLTEASRRFHRHVRRTSPARPRPVSLNTWEAVYFDHDLDRLRALADRAAAVGVERFVLDDGWFGGRRDDTAGLGDWWVSPDAHPGGLAPLIDHVTGLGMTFGIWVEPEMVNEDSELFRAHPDWVLGDPFVTGRNQHVLDLSIDACWTYLWDCLHRLLVDHDIDYVKWDMNRDLAGAGSHAQVHALYRLLDALGDAHPAVTFESCASGGGRADLGILARTSRIWTSDCNDALERQTIQRGFSHLFPPEVMGAHIGPPRAHTTGRTQRLAFRAATALFGHLGVEWNLLDASDRHLAALTWWIELHKELRPLLHGGDVVRLDSPDPAGLAHGVVAADRSEGLFCWAQCVPSRHSHPPVLRLAGLDPDRAYRVAHVACPGEVFGLARLPAWMTDGPVEASGRWLMAVGLQVPLLHPESAVLVRLTS